MRSKVGNNPASCIARVTSIKKRGHNIKIIIIKKNDTKPHNYHVIKKNLREVKCIRCMKPIH